jgi:ABC-2 type transport system ATP-binding protein
MSQVPAIEVSHLAKAFGGVCAVADVSFQVEPGEIVGLLGPNGAGKTTTIRMVLDIFRPDRGTIAVLGGPLTEAKKNRIGYLPEERGLYQDLPLERCLLYLAALKGVPEREARRRLEVYLERFDLAAHRKKTVKALSKGMQQKAQLIHTLLPRPELIIVDEPFTALDPINVQLVKDLLREARAQGAAIVMSTHQMHLVEELCDRILLIDHGRDVLSGRLDDVRRRFAGHAVSVRAAGALPRLAGVRDATPQNGGFRLALAAEATPQEVLVHLVSAGVVLEKFEVAIPSLEEIFIRVVEDGGGQ